MESIQPAQPADAAAVLELIKARIRWMDEQGIRQWNTTGYLEAYGLDYFMQAARQGVLYVLRPPQGPIQGAVILLEEDPRWPDGAPACYVHNLVTACGVPGAGQALLAFCRRHALGLGKQYLRLDCAADNRKLNRYYEAQGFQWAGSVEEGPYRGNKRQVLLAEEDAP